jgi:hypothetical protein
MFKTEVDGVRYLCQNDGTCVAESTADTRGILRDLAFRNFVEIGGKKYLLKSITGMSERGMETVRIPKRVEKIDKKCFYHCDWLCEITFESRSELKEIGEMAFYLSGLRSIQIPKSVEKIDKECFYHCDSLCEIRFESPSELKEIGESAFSLSGLKSIQIPKNVRKIDKGCLYGCYSLCEIRFESPC